MPATRNLVEFTVTTTEGKTISIRRRCHGTGKAVQKQFDHMVWDEKAERFRPAPKKVEKPVGT